MIKYVMYVDGELYATFEAKSDLAAKRRVSKICFDSPQLYSKLTGIELRRSSGHIIAYYLPFFSQWLNN